MDAMTAQARRFYHHVHHGGTLKESDVAAMVRAMEGKDATIARLTAERDAIAAAAYVRAASVTMPNGSIMGGKTVPLPEHWQSRIRALATEAETDALAEMLDAETRACAEIAGRMNNGETAKAIRRAILARLDQPKAESGE